LIYDIGGGIPGGKKFKAVQTGGPSGGCIPAGMMDQPIEYQTTDGKRAAGDYLDLPIDYESLTEVGSMMGSGGMVVMDEDTCMVDVARYFLAFTQDESCGACTPCREGTKLMLNILTKITDGYGTLDDLRALEEIAWIVKQTSLCGLGKTAPNPVLTTLRYFRDEYLAHIEAHKCPAHVCRELNTYRIDPEVCVERGHGCGVCKRECPEKAIFGEKNQPHRIDAALCGKCGVCVDVCHFNAVIVE